jgi:hypothetical protein
MKKPFQDKAEKAKKVRERYIKLTEESALLD